MTEPKQRLDPVHFPAFAQFLAGYLHEDFVVEHKTPAGALRAFVADASPDERERVRGEAQHFLIGAASIPWPDVQAAFTRLGGAWRPHTRAELAALVALVHDLLPPQK